MSFHQKVYIISCLLMKEKILNRNLLVMKTLCPAVHLNHRKKYTGYLAVFFHSVCD